MIRAAIAVGVMLALGARVPAGELTSAEIDRMLARDWRKAHVKPAPLVDDARFLRRAWLDLAGTIPPPEAVSTFLADGSKGKRAQAIEQLLQQPSFTKHLASWLDHALLGRFVRSPLVDRAAFDAWLEGMLARNAGWDEIARGLVTASGDNTTHGEVAWLLRYADAPQDLAGKLARVMLGVQVQCAQCHDHPTEKWKREDFRRLAAVFAYTGPQPLGEPKQKGGVRPVELKDFPIPVVGLRKAMDPDLRAIAQARPAALDGTDLGTADHRRQAFAAWMVAPGNPWFARAFVNRLWASLLGRGFVEPIDDFRSSNPPAAPEVLDALQRDFIAHHHDIRRLVRLICGTRAYQLQPSPTANGDAERLWARYRLRPLGAEELLAAILDATQVEPVLMRYLGAGFTKQRRELEDAVTFLFDVDEEPRAQDQYEGTLPQALMLMNGAFLNSAASALPGTALASLLKLPGTDEDKVTALYLRTLSRPPSKEELAQAIDFLHAPREAVATPAPNRGKPDGKQARRTADPTVRIERTVSHVTNAEAQAYEDLLWALLNASEFNFKH